MFDVDSACTNLIVLMRFYMLVALISAGASVMGAMDADGATLAMSIIFSIVFLGFSTVAAMCSITILSYIQDDYNAKLKAKQEASTAAAK